MNQEHTNQCKVIGDTVNARIQSCVDDLKLHIVEEEKKVNTIHDEIKNIKENHLAHIQVDMATVRANQEWLMKTYWVITTAAIGGLVVGLFNLMK